MRDDSWLHRRSHGDDLPPAAERARRAAGLDCQDEAAAEGHIHDALAPGHLAEPIAAYKFYFYRHRLAEALPYARARLAEAQRRAQLPADWRDVQAADAAFTSLKQQPRLFLFALTAVGTILARLGRVDEAHAALDKVADLDPADRIGARRLLAVIDRGGQDEDACLHRRPSTLCSSFPARPGA